MPAWRFAHEVQNFVSPRPSVSVSLQFFWAAVPADNALDVAGERYRPSFLFY